jgi:hypothetical protein
VEDWKKIVQEAEGKAQSEREATAAREAAARAKRHAHLTELTAVMRIVVLPILEKADAAVRELGRAATLTPTTEANEDPANPWVTGVLFRISKDKGTTLPMNDAPASEFKIVNLHDGRLYFSTAHKHGPQGAKEHVIHQQITAGWVESRLKVFIENALS